MIMSTMNEIIWQMDEAAELMQEISERDNNPAAALKSRMYRNIITYIEMSLEGLAIGIPANMDLINEMVKDII